MSKPSKAVLLGLLGIAGYEFYQASSARSELEALRASQRADMSKLSSLQSERAAMGSRLDSNAVQLGRLIVEVGDLRSKGRASEAASRASGGGWLEADKQAARSPFVVSILNLAGRALELDRQFKRFPDKDIPEIGLLNETDWFRIAGDLPSLETEEKIEGALNRLCLEARRKFSQTVAGSLFETVGRAASGKLGAVAQISDLKPFLSSAINERMLERYEILAPPALLQDWRSVYAKETPPDILIREKTLSAVSGNLADTLRIGLFLKNGSLMRVTSYGLNGGGANPANASAASANR